MEVIGAVNCRIASILNIFCGFNPTTVKGSVFLRAGMQMQDLKCQAKKQGLGILIRNPSPQF